MTLVYCPPIVPQGVGGACLPSFVERTARDRADDALNRASHSFADLLILRAATFDNTGDRAIRERDAIHGIVADLLTARRALADLAGAA